MAAVLNTLASVLSCYALGATALKVETHAHFVTDVLPEEYEAIKGADLHTEGMERMHIIAWDGHKDNVTIMGYPKAEDKEVSGSLQYDAHWETRHTSKLCDPWQKQHRRGVFLDVGANIGTYSLPMSACTKHTGNGTVLSIEGMPTIADHFRAGILANGADNVALYPYAVGGTDGPDSVTMMLDPENKGGSSVAGNKAGDTSLAKAGVKEVQVPLTTVDTMAKGDFRFRAVLSAKIDIEGNEGRFFQGAETLFTESPPCFLMVELIPEWLRNAGTPVDKILEDLKRWGYKDVPSAEHLETCKWGQRTIHIVQQDMGACLARVESAYAFL